MNDAFAAGTFFLLKRAFVKAHEGVFLELSAFLAYLTVCAVVVFAVDFYHVSYGLLFTFHSFVFWVGYLRLHVISSSNYKLGHAQIRLYPKMLGI